MNSNTSYIYSSFTLKILSLNYCYQFASTQTHSTTDITFTFPRIKSPKKCKMVTPKIPLLVTLPWLVLTVTATSRTPQIKPAIDAGNTAKHVGGTLECLGAFLELKSCSNEMFLFLLNGRSHLGIDCCRAIRIITHECWPSMLTSLGQAITVASHPLYLQLGHMPDFPTVDAR
ncbi:egg cell-secreted protein 1.1-like [Primulina huaijiensis]|uniref:egg cell-secreted protein 1.1-like n=1 Tax=Primulina huaijiensis TaxID=1492673 RepID=UPI003CC7668D